MHRLVARTVAVVSLAALVAGGSLTAHAKDSRPKSWGGKKAIGEIVSFDPATSALVVDLVEGEDFTGTVAEDAKVKMDHRGHSRKNSGHGNPTRGSLEDLVAGALVLRLKTEDDVVTKIKLRRAPDASPAGPAEDGDDSDDTGDALPDGSGDDVDDILDGDDEADDTDEDDADADEDADTPDDGESEDAEETLPPLPVALP